MAHPCIGAQNIIEIKMYQKIHKNKYLQIQTLETPITEYNWLQNKYLVGQKTSKIILPRIEPEKINNQWI